MHSSTIPTFYLTCPSQDFPPTYTATSGLSNDRKGILTRETSSLLYSTSSGKSVSIEKLRIGSSEGLNLTISLLISPCRPQKDHWSSRWLFFVASGKEGKRSPNHPYAQHLNASLEKLLSLSLFPFELLELAPFRDFMSCATPYLSGRYPATITFPKGPSLSTISIWKVMCPCQPVSNKVHMIIAQQAWVRTLYLLHNTLGESFGT